eukprot:TRINITY_DN9018_c0_g3_i1.p8 TRINITY_DN9018_c0_g3~~TRINITY_DN9018_c0_g3_i1.p8  ORF type:complete len:116 (-),score=11.32 TRINITY_DN9018_c0_g3_i1:93-440(-)
MNIWPNGALRTDSCHLPTATKGCVATSHGTHLRCGTKASAIEPGALKASRLGIAKLRCLPKAASRTTTEHAATSLRCLTESTTAKATSKCILLSTKTCAGCRCSAETSTSIAEAW